MKCTVSQLCPAPLYFGGIDSFHPAVSKIQNKDHVDCFFFFDSQAVVHNVLDRLCKRIARVRPALWKDRSLRDNAPAHTAAIVTQSLARKMVAILDRPTVFTRFKSSGLFPEV